MNATRVVLLSLLCLLQLSCGARNSGSEPVTPAFAAKPNATLTIRVVSDKQAEPPNPSKVLLITLENRVDGVEPFLANGLLTPGRLGTVTVKFRSSSGPIESSCTDSTGSARAGDYLLFRRGTAITQPEFLRCYDLPRGEPIWVTATYADKNPPGPCPDEDSPLAVPCAPGLSEVDLQSVMRGPLTSNTVEFTLDR